MIFNVIGFLCIGKRKREFSRILSKSKNMENHNKVVSVNSADLFLNSIKNYAFQEFFYDFYKWSFKNGKVFELKCRILHGWMRTLGW